MLSMISDLKAAHGISIHEGEDFKQAFYNGRLTDPESHVRDKIELAIKHYPGRDLVISAYESDETSPSPFAYVVVLPVHE